MQKCSYILQTTIVEEDTNSHITQHFKGVFGCKEVGGSKEMGSIIAHFPIYPKTRKRK